MKNVACHPVDLRKHLFVQFNLSKD